MNGFCLALAVGMLAGPQSPAPESGPQREVLQPYDARLTGSNVYVRSGPSTVYYHVTKLQHGDILRVVGHQYGFAEIEALDSTFSLIPKDYVEVQDDNVGVLNGEAWVVAYGPDQTEAYAKQIKLQAGDEVQIVDELNDHYRIVPPEGATFWISRDFLIPVSEEAAASLEPAGSPSRSTATTAAPKPAPPGAASEVSPRASTAGARPAPDAQVLDPGQNVTEVADIKQLEERLQGELKKDKPQRAYGSIIDGFKQLEQTHADPRVRQYASYRADQLRKTLDRGEALRRIQEIDAQIQGQRRQFNEERSELRPNPPPVSRDFAVVGKMLKSFAYTNPVGPRRFRIVDVDEAGQRTIAYIEIDPDSGIDPQEFLGRHVGVRAHSKRLIEGAVEPVVVYNAAEIVVLEQPPDESVSLTAKEQDQSTVVTADQQWHTNAARYTRFTLP